MIPAAIQPGRPVSSGADGTYLIVQNGYSRGRRHQWGPELARNALQALMRSKANGVKPRGNEQIVFDFVPLEFVDGSNAPILSDIWKRRVWNTAEPMAAVELMDYFSSLAKGAGTNRFSITNLSGQYGQGSRFSVLPHSGMFVATTQPGGGTDALFIYDTGLGTYSLANFTYPNKGMSDDTADMRQDCYLDLGNGQYLEMIEDELIAPEVIKDGGVTTILMGPDIFDHYTEGDPNRQETSRRLVDDLTRWMNFPIPVYVEYTYEAKKVRAGGRKIQVGTKTKFVEKRQLKTYSDWVNRVPLSNEATVQLHNPDGGTTNVDVYLLPEDWNWSAALTPAERKAVEAKKGKIVERNGVFFEVVSSRDQWMPWDGMGFVVFSYDDEMIPVYDTGNRTVQLKNWGVNVSEVAERTAIVISPPQLTSVGSTTWGVQQTGSRGTLLGPNESALPMDDWTNEFFDLLQTSPDLDFLRKALESAKPTHSRTIDPDDLKRIREEMSGRMDLTPQKTMVTTKRNTGVPATAATNTVTGFPEHNGTGPKPLKPAKTPRNKVTGQPGPVFATPLLVPMMPNYEFLSTKEWADRAKIEPEFSPEMFCVVEDGGGGTTLFFNRGHEIFVGQRTHYTSPTGYFKEVGNLKRLKMLKLADIEQVIENVYATLGIGTVFYALRMSKTGSVVDRHKFHTLVEPERMTMALGSFVNVDHAIKYRISRL